MSILGETQISLLTYLPAPDPHGACGAVASLGWVTLWAATEGVTPLFFPEKPGDLFFLIAVIIAIAFYCFHSGVTPLDGVTPYLFYMSGLVSLLFFVNLPAIFSLRVSPAWRVSPRAVRPRHPLPLVTPLTTAGEGRGGGRVAACLLGGWTPLLSADHQ